MLNLELHCNKKLHLAPRDPETGSLIIEGAKTDICNGLLALRERIVHANGVDYVYSCTRCGAKKILFGSLNEEETETTRKSPVIQEDEDRILEQNR